MSGFSKASSSIVVASYSYTAQTANIATTSIPYWNGPNGNSAGLYRVTYQIEVDTAAGVSSTLPGLVITAYNRQGVQNTITTATSTTNTTATFTSGVAVVDVRSGTSNDVTYATTGYTSVGSPAMIYSLRFSVEYLGNV
jgi:hypothetical protein